MIYRNKIEPKGWLFLAIYKFPSKKKTRKQETTDILVEKIMKNVKEYQSKPDYFIEAFKRKLRDIGKF